MIKLVIMGTETHEYKTKKEALREIKDNGLSQHSYILLDTKNGTQYRSGLWLTQDELCDLADGATIREIRYRRGLCGGAL